MSTQNWITLTPLAGGLRMITGEFSGAILDANSQFTVHVGNIERILKPILITNDGGWIVEIQDCDWLEKLGGPADPTLGPNDLVITVRTNPAAGGPHAAAAAYEDLTEVTFEAVLIVH